MNKNEIYNAAENLSFENEDEFVFVWETHSGEWKYGMDFPEVYESIVAKFMNGLDIL